MTSDFTLRSEAESDLPFIRAIHEAAFGGRAEADLVEALRREGDLALALTAFADRPVGDVAFPRLILEGSDVGVLALAPLAVLPDWQNRGIGAALVREALDRVRGSGEDVVLVRGHPAYYPRFGFSAEAVKAFRTPYDGPAMHALALTERGRSAGGVIRYPPAFARLL